MALPPRNTPPGQSVTTVWLRVLGVLEATGRLAVFVVPFFFRIRVATCGDRIAAGVMAVALGIYYTGWWRYLRYGRDYGWLWKPLWGIPVPLAVSPVLYFAAASIVLHSAALTVAAAVLAVSRVPLSNRQARRLVI
jgi:hypothetical protein